MSDKPTIHWSFWVISVIAFVWNGLGSVNFFVQMDPEMLEMYRESERAMVNGRPMWATIGFGLGVFGGAIGSLLLLLKKAIAFYVFIASLVGVLITMVHSLTSGVEFGVGEIIGIILMPIVVAVLLIWYAKFTEKKGWLG